MTAHVMKEVEVTSTTTYNLGVKLSPEEATELASLLVHHVSFCAFPWAERIYDALSQAGIPERDDLFQNDERAFPAENVFLRRRKEETV